MGVLHGGAGGGGVRVGIASDCMGTRACSGDGYGCGDGVSALQAGEMITRASTAPVGPNEHLFPSNCQSPSLDTAKYYCCYLHTKRPLGLYRAHARWDCGFVFEVLWCLCAQEMHSNASMGLSPPAPQSVLWGTAPNSSVRTGSLMCLK